MALDGLTLLKLEAKNILCFRDRGMYKTQSQIKNNYSIHLPAENLCSGASWNDFEHYCLNACSSLLDKLLVQVSESKPSHIPQHYGFHP